MSTYIPRFLFYFVVLQLIIPYPTLAAAIGEFTSVFGNVTQARTKEVIRPVTKSSIELKDVITTDRASATAMVFSDDSTIMLSENTKLEIKEFLFKGKARRGIFSLAVGKLMVNVKKYVGGDNVFEVYSPTAAIGVRGTGFEFVEAIKEGNTGPDSANQGMATVTCTEGSLNVSAFSATGAVVSTAVIQAGHVAVIVGGIITISPLRATGKSPQQAKTPESPKPYNPLSDPNLKAPVPIGDRSRAEKFASDFQKGQWTPLETKEQKIKEQQPGQPQPPAYLSSSTTTTLTTAPPGDSSIPTTVLPGATSAPTTVSQGVMTAPSTVSHGGTTTASTVRPGGTTAASTVRPGGTTAATTAKPTTIKPATTTTGSTPQNLTDVTVDRRDVTITVWDHGAEDGDIITIYLNGKVLKSKLLLTNKKQSFQVKLTGGQNRFEVEAVNEGSTPPNTATVEISNVTKGKPSQVYERKTGQRASMNLVAP